MPKSNIKPSDSKLPKNIEAWVKDRYEENYKRLKMDGGHALAPHVQLAGLTQVIMYLIKMTKVVASVTETEVKLTLPNITSPAGTKFNIVGVIDIVREKGTITLYDIKTHDPAFIHSNMHEFSDQLDIYAHIWTNLRGQKVNNAAIIATKLPNSLQKIAFLYATNREYNQQEFKKEMDKWNPIIPINSFTKDINNAVNNFSHAVDNIEGCNFEPKSIEQLKESSGRGKQTFASNTCRNCDARFSCSSFRTYAKENFSRHDKFLRYLSELPEDDMDDIPIDTSNMPGDNTTGNIEEHLAEY